jgi:hypothetical protein
MKTKITLKDYLVSVNYSITDGAEFLWDCYGENALIISNDKKRGNNFICSTGVVFDADKQTVYEMTVWDYEKNEQYRWISPRYSKKHREEEIKRGFVAGHSIDKLSFIEVTIEKILSKAKELCRTKSAKKKKC